MQQSHATHVLFQHPPRRSAGAEAETGTEKSARCTACHKGDWTAGWLIRYSDAKQVDAITVELFCCEEAKWSRAKAKEKSLVIKKMLRSNKPIWDCGVDTSYSCAVVVHDVCCGTVTPSTSATSRSYHKVAKSKSQDMPFCLVLGILASSLRGWTFRTTELTHRNSTVGASTKDAQ